MTVAYFGLSNGFVELAVSTRALVFFEKVVTYLRKTPAAIEQHVVPLERMRITGHTLKLIIAYAECNADPATTDDEKMTWCVAALQPLTFDETIALCRASQGMGYTELMYICEALLSTSKDC